MVVLRLFGPALQSSAWAQLRAGIRLLKRETGSPSCTQLVRHMGGGGARQMQKTATKFEYTTFKDDLHFYFLVGVIPIGLLITYNNVFIGQSELTEIPEDYEPKHWEYHSHPIKRFFARYIYDSPEKCYEKTLHKLESLTQERRLWDVEAKVRRLMRERQDYKGWYYRQSFDKAIHDKQRNEREWTKEQNFSDNDPYLKP